MTYQERRQKALGKASKRVHKRLGVRVDYTAVTDQTTNPLSKTTILNMPIKPTPTKWVRSSQGMRRIKSTEDIYIVSRESLKIGGVFHEPNTDDSFVKTGTVTPILRIKNFDEDHEEPGTYTLLVEAHDGFSVRGQRRD